LNIEKGKQLIIKTKDYLPHVQLYPSKDLAQCLFFFSVLLQLFMLINKQTLDLKKKTKNICSKAALYVRACMDLDGVGYPHLSSNFQSIYSLL
jgi:hypothetical protein